MIDISVIIPIKDENANIVPLAEELNRAKARTAKKRQFFLSFKIYRSPIV